MEQESHETQRWLKQDTFADIEIPEALHTSLERHRRNLAALIVNLRSVGVSDEMIEASVSVIVASYKEELIRSIRSIVR